jgi:hypothetical protein
MRINPLEFLVEESVILGFVTISFAAILCLQIRIFSFTNPHAGQSLAGVLATILFSGRNNHQGFPKPAPRKLNLNMPGFCSLKS